MKRFAAPLLLVLGMASFACSGARPAPSEQTAAHAHPGGIAIPAAQPSDGTAVDRDYTLEASILGYRGVGGEIDGVRNPLLRAAPGETVRITILGVELMPHDWALEKAGVKTTEVIDVGQKTSTTFTARESDIYFCTIPGHRAAGMVGKFEVSDAATGGENTVAGMEPQREGRALNLGFEAGTMADWAATGDAFGQAPIRGDVVAARTGNTHSRHGGSYWASSGEASGPRATGAMTSVPFAVEQPYATFRVAGGALKDTRVELVRADGDSVVFEISGNNQASLRPVVVDLSRHAGQEIYVRLVDGETGISDIPYIPHNDNAYISFDDFRFHSSRPEYANELKPSDIQILPPLDYVKHSGLSGTDAAAAMTVPEGFKVTLAAAEPEIVRPIAFAQDDRGRLWVVEANTYPVRAPEGQGRDRLYIFEDTDGDGTLDDRKVVMDTLNLVSGIEVGFGGVWIGSAPYLLFIPIDPATDKPSGPQQILLDGWGYTDTHETLNSLQWGPDGWLYGTHGVFVESNVGKPGAPANERVHVNAGVWRYHPQRHVFERFMEGTSNPWGIDFDDYGSGFITACVIPHLYHTIPGARYQRQALEHDNPYTFDDIKTHADHIHWVGTYGPHAGNNRSDLAGGGHAHSGAMVYLGGSWPDEYRNRIFMNNIHGARTNTDLLERSGSGYAGRHGADFLFANDNWSQMLDYQYGPDGSVHIIDWYDKNQCHSANPDVHQKTLGRIFKVSYKDDRWTKVDLQSKTDEELVALQLHENDWYVRHARRILQERGPRPAVHAGLRRILRENRDVTRRLRAMWALHVTGGLPDSELIVLLADGDEYVRAWSLQLLAEDYKLPKEALTRMAVLAREDASALVRLHLAAAMLRTPPENRWDVLTGLYAHAEDADDHNLPLMVWYAAEPMPTLNMDRALGMAMNTRLPGLLPYTVQRIAAIGSPEAVRTLSEHLGRAAGRTQQQEILKGLNQLVGGTK